MAVYFAEPVTSKNSPNIFIKSVIITQVFSSDPKLNELLIQGMEKGIQGDYQGAIADFGEVIRRNPHELEAYYNRGIAYVQMTEYQKAITDFDRAIKLDPNSAEVYLERAKVYYLLGNYPQTRVDLQTAIQLFQHQNNASGYQEAQDLLNQL